MARPGRPRRVVPVTELELLTIPQVLLYLREIGCAKSRAKVKAAIVAGRLAAFVDWEHLDRKREPIYRIERSAVDRWIRASLQPLKVIAFAS